MSAYIVDDSTINRILAAAELYTQCNLAEVPAAPKDIIGADPTFLDWALLGAKMREMNVAAVVARYGPEKPFPGPSPLLPYSYQSMSAPSPVQAIKSLACYLYQCTEGEVPTFPLYQQFRKWEDDLCVHYVQQSDEWRQALWG